jgi:hypothetical protein
VVSRSTQVSVEREKPGQEALDTLTAGDAFEYDGEVHYLVRFDKNHVLAKSYMEKFAINLQQATIVAIPLGTMVTPLRRLEIRAGDY